MRICKKCKKLKNYSEFVHYNDRSYSDRCKACQNEKYELFLQGLKKCSKCHCTKKLDQFHNSRSRKYGKYPYCKTCVAPITSKYQKQSPEKARVRWHRWKNKDKDKYLKIVRNIQKRRYATLNGNINIKMTSAINHSIRNNKNGYHWEKVVGYTLSDLKKHLENLFTEGMSWELLLQGKIHIDHKFPLSACKIETIDSPGFKKAWALTNLQPLWAKDNYKKYNKIVMET